MRAVHVVIGVGIGVAAALFTARASENRVSKLLVWDPVGCFSLGAGALAKNGA